ncbi:glycoside hydrolase family 3 protein [Nocardiopsis sp. CNT312]|uniref:glycoside hydrolase family 3 protein n=1 Tax=Nocardiopsis sp. CNT312 TaxID=1137268 RepID=UPI00048EC05D|nr:glycoside hydrolase family 3 N-terminal domain-containing protein [Nocardiopsis sp. CNT312]
MRPSLRAALAPLCALLALTVASCTSQEPGGTPSGEGGQEDARQPVLAPELLAEMDLDDKIGQLMVLSAQGTSPEENAAQIEAYRPGGLIYFTANLAGTGEIVRMSNGLQELAAQQGAGVPLFLGIDQEQGLVSRLTAGTRFPDAMAVGATRDPAMAELLAATTAEELAALGINLDYAPVADVNTDPDNPVIGIRSFGSDPALVAEMAVAEAGAFAEGGVASVVKHFPGHGDTDVDSHTGLPVIDLPREEWEAGHLPPFRAAVDAGVDAIMTAHVVMPQLDADTPATLSPEIIGGVLREELGYDGVVTTDALNMEGVRQGHTDGEIAVRAIEAGVDQLLMPPDPAAALEALRTAVREGRLTEERIDESVLRILALKEERGVLDAEPADAEAAQAVLEDPEHAEAAQSVADASVTVLRDGDGLLPLAEGASVSVRGQGGTEITDALREAGVDVVGLGPDADAVVVGTDGARGSAEQRAVVDAARAQGQPVIVVAQGGPYDLEVFPEVEAFLAVYSSVEVSRYAAARVIAGVLEPSGTLPVDIPGAGVDAGTGLTF